MRKLFSFLLAVLVMVTAPAVFAENASASCGDAITWSVNGNILYITGQGEMYDFPDGAPWESYKSAITAAVISDGVTYIGAGSFKDYDKLTNVQFGNSLVAIGANAFTSCDGLSSVYLPATFKKFGENSFRNCANLREIHCLGYCPRFESSAVWDTHCIIYYPFSNEWPSEALSQLEAAFNYNIQFRGTEIYEPTPVVQPETVPVIAETVPPTTEPVYTPTQEPVYTPTQEAAFVDPQVFTRPTEVTIPATEATIPTTEAPVIYTEPAATTPPTQSPAAAPTEAPFLLGTQPTQAPETTRDVGSSSMIGLLIIILVLTLIAIGTLIFRMSYRHSRRRGRR